MQRIHIIARTPAEMDRGNPLSPTNTGAPSVATSGFTSYPDRGCEHSDSCLECPLPLCKHDMPHPTVKTAGRAERELIIAQEVIDQNLSYQEAAQRLGVTLRTVFRIMKRARATEQQQQEKSA